MTTMQTIDDGYRAGACNIGPAEIDARRRSGHVGVAATIGLFALLVLLDAPTWMRLVLAAPAALAAAGYLQAAMRFCAAYGWAGVFNLTERIRDTQGVADVEARAADRRAALRIAGLSALIGIGTALVAILLPI